MEKKQRKVFACQLDDFGMFGVGAISFVDVPAIDENFIALNKEQEILLAKAVDNEKRMVYGPVLIPEIEIFRRSEDMPDGYYITFSKDVIEQTMHLFMQKKMLGNFTMQHQDKVEDCSVVESWIKQSEVDKSVELGLNVPIGTWIIGTKVNNDEVWAEVKAGNVRGYSVEAFYNMVEMSMQLTDSEFLMELEKIIFS